MDVSMDVGTGVTVVVLACEGGAWDAVDAGRDGVTLLTAVGVLAIVGCDASLRVGTWMFTVQPVTEAATEEATSAPSM